MRDPLDAPGASATVLPTGTVTFVMTDIEGSTRLLQSLGGRYPDLLAEHYRLVGDACAGAGGTLVSTEGDALFFVFRDAPSAVRAALDAQRALAAHQWPAAANVRVRIGVHTGEGQLLSNDYVGLDVHRAARIAGAGHGGQVLMSDAARALTEGTLPEGAHFRDLGEHRLKDLERAEHLFQLVALGLPGEFPPLRSLGGRPNNLPAQITTFVGRVREKDELLGLLRANRLLTLTGPGGTGKTRLSLEIAATSAASFDDGVFVVPLAPIFDPELLIPTIAAALGIREVSTRPIRDSLVEHLEDRSLLLVLDNFEQLVAAAPAVGDVLAAAPRLKALVTSREPLRIAGEQEFPVPPLEVPNARAKLPLDKLRAVDSVALFLERARAVRPDFDLSPANAAAVAEICARLDGLPLAIELAAARSRLFEPRELLSRLDNRLTFLAGGRDVGERQRTLRGAIGWSHELLDEREQVLFRRLAVFAGGCMLDAVEAVCDPGELGLDAVDAVSSLHDKSLLRRDEATSDDLRISMLETIREYALERLDASAEAAEIRRRHAAFFLELAQRASAEVRGPERQRWLDGLERELDNFRAAIRWAIRSDAVEPGMRLAATLEPLWIFGNHLREGRRHLDELLGQPSAADVPEAPRAAALGAAASLAVWQADYSAARRLAQESLAIYRALGDSLGIARQLSSLGYAAIIADPVDALRFFGESIAAYRDAGEPSDMGESLIGMAMPALQLRRVAEARAYLDEATLIFERAGDEPLALVAAGLRGVCDRLAGDLAAAQRRYVDVLVRSHRVGSDVVTTLPLAALADLALINGNPERAATLDAAVARLAERLGGTPTFELVGIPAVAERARAELGEEDYERAVSRGQLMPVNEVVRFALSDTGDSVTRR
jgi:predicted ATPase/class 3 adenylate cyclase